MAEPKQYWLDFESLTAEGENSGKAALAYETEKINEIADIIRTRLIWSHDVLEIATNIYKLFPEIVNIETQQNDTLEPDRDLQVN
jgi:hypothetical protein